MPPVGSNDWRGVRDLHPQEFARIAGVMRNETGIELPDSKLPLVQARLLRRVRNLKLQSYAAYCDVIEDAEGATERLNMVSALTTNVTGFYREPHHFDYLRKHVLDDLATRLKRGGKVRIWSAGCSSGEEPYSLVLTFLEAIPDLARHNFKLLATDIDPGVLKTAAAGVYREGALTSVPEQLRAEYFEPLAAEDGVMRIRSTVRNLVVFRHLNLIENWPLNQFFDIIMCRNVVIYFGDDTKAEIWTRLADRLHPDGLLFAGHSERLSGPAAERMRLVATTTYCARHGSGEPKGTI